MSYRALFVLTFMVLVPAIAPAQTFAPPPQTYSKQQIGNWVNEQVRITKPSLPVNLMETEEWADYVNYKHFVPLTLEGVPPGYKFDYGWVETENPRRSLPTAEVTETGEFMMWWQRCGYYQLSEEACRGFIRLVVRHEARHSDQWQRIAVNVLTFLGRKVDPQKLPLKLDELLPVAGAEEAFMRIWADEAHYQCREVEAYTADVENGDMTKEVLGEEGFQGSLQTLYVYFYGNEHSPGCINSKWVPEFSVYLKKAEALFKANNLPPPKAGR